MLLLPFLLALVLPSAARAATPMTYGPRPYFLVDDMSPSELKTQLRECMEQTPTLSLFSIGHRGAPAQFPEHTKESYVAAARMGAGILECELPICACSAVAGVSVRA